MDAVWALIGALMGATITGYFQVRAAEKQASRQLELAERQFEHSLMMLDKQNQNELQQKEEASNQLIKSYIVLLIPMLKEIASIRYLSKRGEDNPDEIYQKMKRGILDIGNKIDSVNPQENRGYHIVFLIFQFIAAFKIALSSRFLGAITEEQRRFLNKWESKIEQVFCSSQYPGKPWFYREKIDVLAEDMLIISDKTGILRPMNWREFVEKLSRDETFKELVEGLRNDYSYIFNDSKDIRARYRSKCRISIFGLYLLDLLNERERKEHHRFAKDIFLKGICSWYEEEENKDQYKSFYLFEKGDINAFCQRIKNGQPLVD